MIKTKIAGFCAAACLAITMAGTISEIPVVEAVSSTTVTGTIQSGTTDTLMYLSTTGGTMEIKINSDTDTSDCKVLLPDKKVSVTCYRGGDACMHQKLQVPMLLPM